MGDEVPIEVEPVEPDELGGFTGPAGSGGRGGSLAGDVSSRRVVQSPGRGKRLVAALVLGALVAAGFGLVARGGRGDGDDRRPDGSAEAEPPPADEAYTAAVARLGQARSFAFRGTVRATGRSSLRPGSWIADEVDVGGTVLLPHSITHELASTPRDGPLAETVSTGLAVWTRSASDRTALGDARWTIETPPGQDPTLASEYPVAQGPGRVGIALVVDVLRAATEGRRGGLPDSDGRRRLRATVPANQDSRQELGDLLAGAEVLLVLDDAGDIAEIAITAGPPDDRDLAIDLTIEQVGETGLVTPADVGGPARAALDVGALEDAGLHPVEPTGLPAGWGLIAASGRRIGPMARCGTGQSTRPCRHEEAGCPVLTLHYQDLTAVSGGSLTLGVSPGTCLAGPSAADGARRADPLRAGRFSGWVDASSRQATGLVSDGRTTISFSTDLSAADVAAVLATLAPFDPAAEPTVLPGVPSS